MRQIRRAEARDAVALGELGALLMRTHFEYDQKRFLEPYAGAARGYGSFLTGMLDDDESAIFVSEEDGVVTGYVWAALEPLSWKELRGPAGFIHDIAVREESRRGGTARLLMNAATAWLRQMRAPRVVLWTAAPNSSAQRLFRELGFRDTMIEMTMEL